MTVGLLSNGYLRERTFHLKSGVMMRSTLITLRVMGWTCSARTQTECNQTGKHVLYNAYCDRPIAVMLKLSSMSMTACCMQAYVQAAF